MTSWSDERLETVVGTFLRAGVTVSAAVVALGGILYLFQHSFDPVHYSVFIGEPANLRTVSGILRGVFSLDAPSIIQFGLLLLIATPVTRVALSAIVFALQGDRTYIVITLIVLAILLYSLTGGISNP
jgi:uncharacterized membrane protein